MSLKYESIFSQKQKDWCLPACLQTILYKKEIETTQEDISKKFTRNKILGVDFNLETLNSFLKSHSLTSNFYNPFMEQIELDLFLREDSTNNDDILLAYNFQQINSIPKETSKHTSLIIEYNPRKETTWIWEPESNQVLSLSLKQILMSIRPAEDKDYGFYTITPTKI